MLVHVIGTGGVNHLVCVDGRAKIIYDSMEWRPHASVTCGTSVLCWRWFGYPTAFSRKMVRQSVADDVGNLGG